MTSVTDPKRLLPPLENQRGDLSIKGLEEEPWVRLDSPTGDKRYDCCGVIFDGGIIVVQEIRTTKGTCTVNFIVDSPKTTFESTGPRPATDAGLYLQEISEVSTSELDFRKDRIMKQTGCRVSLLPIGCLES